MTILEYNPNVCSKTTYEVPVLFGVPRYEKRSLFSYSIYENNIVQEVRFKDRLVLKYYFDAANLLERIDRYDERNNLYSMQFTNKEKADGLILIEQITLDRGANVRCVFKKDDVKEQWSLTFLGRVDSFLGNKISGVFNGVKDSTFQEERYFQRKTFSGPMEFKIMLQNEYVMKDQRIDEIARGILSEGWNYSQNKS